MKYSLERTIIVRR